MVINKVTKKSRTRTTTDRQSRGLLKRSIGFNKNQLLITIGIVTLLGIVAVIFVSAATNSATEPETWSSSDSGKISIVNDATASNGKYIQFLAQPPTGGTFPTATSTGVPSNVTTKKWTGVMSSSAIAGKTETVNGITYKVIDGYLFDMPAGQYFSLSNSGNVLIRNSQFIGHGIPSNTMALIQEADSGATVRFDNIDINANGYARGINSDNANIIVNNSKFINTSDAAVEKNDRNMRTDMTVTNSYIAVDCTWLKNDPGSHTDGVQWGGARNIVIRNNTILIDPCLANFKATGIASDAAVAGWAELGNVDTSVVDHNLLAGGGYTVYMQIKDSFKWNSASFTNNVLDRRYGGGDGKPLGSTSGIWGVLFPDGIPSNLTWSGNTWDNGNDIPLVDVNK